MITDRLASYGAALQGLPELSGALSIYVSIPQPGGTTAVEQSHLPTRLRERRMQGFKSIDSAQRFLSLFSRVCKLFRPCRNLLTAAQYRTPVEVRSRTWGVIMGVVCA